eukprot:7110733-Pyramimonas_sp.AAC.1
MVLGHAYCRSPDTPGRAVKVQTPRLGRRQCIGRWLTSDRAQESNRVRLTRPPRFCPRVPCSVAS